MQDGRFHDADRYLGSTSNLKRNLRYSHDPLLDITTPDIFILRGDIDQGMGHYLNAMKAYSFAVEMDSSYAFDFMTRKSAIVLIPAAPFVPIYAALKILRHTPRFTWNVFVRALSYT